MRYTKEQLHAMPISVLRGIDIQDIEEEKLVQSVVNARLAEMPVENPVNFSSSQTDGLTPEKEAELQAEINKREAAMRAQLNPEPVEPGPLPEPGVDVPVAEPEPDLAPTESQVEPEEEEIEVADDEDDEEEEKLPVELDSKKILTGDKKGPR